MRSKRECMACADCWNNDASWSPRAIVRAHVDRIRLSLFVGGAANDRSALLIGCCCWAAGGGYRDSGAIGGWETCWATNTFVTVCE
ncbi:hypothetical protein ZHAS_00021638 [Anopheles sinensis]|uniref:Uncharacterized protein n=1 Tax=Anopheles sinensis TaxID=74873 RepID=A0A084WSY7_ANOSI|nr:hypothetical protein ZHAS_00021638 [Anopheles sinensis]